jgi:LPS sulfotransferase NodH
VVYYEDLCLDPLGGVRSAARHVGIDPQRIVHVHSPLQIVRDEVTLSWAERLRREWHSTDDKHSFSPPAGHDSAMSPNCTRGM